MQKKNNNNNVAKAELAQLLFLQKDCYMFCF